jgi:hypothetical protein
MPPFSATSLPVKRSKRLRKCKDKGWRDAGIGFAPFTAPDYRDARCRGPANNPTGLVEFVRTVALAYGPGALVARVDYPNTPGGGSVDTIAERVLELRTESGSFEVGVLVGRPERDPRGDWTCPYEIRCGEAVHQMAMHGIDSMQAQRLLAVRRPRRCLRLVPR